MYNMINKKIKSPYDVKKMAEDAKKSIEETRRENRKTLSKYL
jgi:hypothetical protein